MYRRFTRGRDKLFEFVKQDPDFEWLMIYASYVKEHPHAAGNQDMWNDSRQLTSSETNAVLKAMVIRLKIL